MMPTVVPAYFDCLVIGGGASGFFTAIRLKEEAPHLKVGILEAQQATLGKVKISGGGRCNVTHILQETTEDSVIPKALMGFYPRQYPQLLGHLMTWSPQHMLDWLEKHGVPTKVEKDGRAFPASDDSGSIVQVFESACEAWGIPIRTGARVTDVVKRDDAQANPHLPQFQHPEAQFILRLSNNGLIEAKTVVLATGGSENGYRLAEQLGLALTPKVPSLFTFKMDDVALTELAGVSLPWVKAKLQFPKVVQEAFPKAVQKTIPKGGIVQEGAFLVTHWGVSGPVVLKLSAWGAFALEASGYQAQLLLDSLPSLTDDVILSALRNERLVSAKKWVANACPFENLPKRWWVYLVNKAGMDEFMPWQAVGEKRALTQLAEMLKRLALPIIGKGVFKEEFVTAGGVALASVSPNSLADKTTAGCYVVGELLNVDGLTGGFNFQHCWASANAAACAIAKQLAD
jgi:predicted Rossmann fold flavoprotein